MPRATAKNLPFAAPRAMRPGTLTRRENRAVRRLCGLYSFGILGLYMALPVLSPYAHTLRGRTDLLVGLSVGAYGLTQILFQIPFGHLSDRIGRKKVIALGLVLFAAGGMVCAAGDHIGWLIAGRLLQGAGAMVASVVSLLADLTRPGVRAQGMARFGIAIGISVGAGLVLGPLVSHALGVRPVFWMTSAIALAAGAALLLTVPEPRVAHPEERVEIREFSALLREPRLLLLHGGTLLTHAVVAILFVQLPFDLAARGSGGAAALREAAPRGASLLGSAASLGPGFLAGLGAWLGLAALLGLGAMVLAGRLADRDRRSSTVLFAGTGVLILSCLLFAAAPAGTAAALGAVLVFVVAAALLEPTLPALLTRLAAGEHRGAATGIFHMAQFLGTFCGGLLGGAFLTRGRAPLFGGLAFVAALWLTGMTRTKMQWEGDASPVPPGSREIATE